MTVPASTWGWLAAVAYDQCQRRGQRVYDRHRFEEAIAVDGLRRLDETAERWWSLFVGLTPKHLAECLLDGQPPRYLKRRDDQ